LSKCEIFKIKAKNVTLTNTAPHLSNLLQCNIPSNIVLLHRPEKKCFRFFTLKLHHKSGVELSHCFDATNYRTNQTKQGRLAGPLSSLPKQDVYDSKDYNNAVTYSLIFVVDMRNI